MINASCYDFRIQCDNDNVPYKVDENGDERWETKCRKVDDRSARDHVYTGRTEAECIRKAKADGWKFKRASNQYPNGAHFCPMCGGLDRR